MTINTDPGLFEKILEILAQDPMKLDFTDNMYNSDWLFKESIESNFAGWCNPMDAARQVNFILRTCKPGKDAYILDLACGPGKHSFELGRHTFRVKGIDISDTLIDYLNSIAIGLASFETCSAQNFKERNTYDLVICLGNSLSLMPKNDLVLSLRNIHASMRAHGQLFIQMDNMRMFIQHEASTKVWNHHSNRWLVLSEHYFEPERSVEITRDISFDTRTKNVQVYNLVKRLYSPDELLEILKLAGFNPVSTWGNWDGKRFSQESETLLIRAKKV